MTEQNVVCPGCGKLATGYPDSLKGLAWWCNPCLKKKVKDAR